MLHCWLAVNTPELLAGHYGSHCMLLPHWYQYTGWRLVGYIAVITSFNKGQPIHTHYHIGWQAGWLGYCYATYHIIIIVNNIGITHYVIIICYTGHYYIGHIVVTLILNITPRIILLSLLAVLIGYAIEYIGFTYWSLIAIGIGHIGYHTLHY